MFFESKERKATILDQSRVNPLCDDDESEKRIVKQLAIPWEPMSNQSSAMIRTPNKSPKLSSTRSVHSSAAYYNMLVSEALLRDGKSKALSHLLETL